MNAIQSYLSSPGEFRKSYLISERNSRSFPLSKECKVSIIIPAYNESKTVLQCLESLALQVDMNGNPLSHKFYEVIVIDNNSTDTTVDIVNTWIDRKKHKNFRIIHEKQAGVGHARKRGFDEVVYRYNLRKTNNKHYLLSADADNILPKTWVTKYLVEFETRKLDFIFGISQFNFELLSNLPNMCSFLKLKYAVEKYIKKIYLGRAEGHNYGIEVSAYATVGGIKTGMYFEDHHYYDLPCDDWIFSAEAMRYPQLRLGISDKVEILGNPRKLKQAKKELVDGKLYSENWQELSQRLPTEIYFSHEELSIVVQQQIRGIIAYQLLMSTIHRPSLLESQLSIDFLGEELTKQIMSFIPEVKRVYPLTKFNVHWNCNISTWFLFFHFGKEICKRLQRIFPELEFKMTYPEALVEKLSKTAARWEKELVINAFCDGSSSNNLGKYFGGWF